MAKYSMVTINHKLDENDNLLVRRILISYTNKVQDAKNEDVMNYVGTRFIAKDAYFNDKTKSHQYEFTDDGYKLIEVTNEWKDLETYQGLVLKERVYHHFVDNNQSFWFPPYAAPIEFEADTDEEAIQKFHGREELR